MQGENIYARSTRDDRKRIHAEKTHHLCGLLPCREQGQVSEVCIVPNVPDHVTVTRQVAVPFSATTQLFQLDAMSNDTWLHAHDISLYVGTPK